MSSTTKKLYDTDFAEWSTRTAALIRAGRFDEIDSENVAEEIEDMGKNQRHQLRSRITQIIEHLLKLSLTIGSIRENNERGWRASISRQQGEIRQLLSESPSLRRRLTPDTLEGSYTDAARTVAAEYDVTIPVRCPFGWTEILPPPEKARGKEPGKKNAAK